MALLRLLFTFRGTITRSEWWLGFVILVAGFILAMGTFQPGLFTVDSPPNTMANFVLGLLFTYPAAALLVKRLADLRWPPQVALATIAFSLILQMLDYPRLAISDTFQSVLLWLNLLALLAEIAVCGFVKGKAAATMPAPALQPAWGATSRA